MNAATADARRILVFGRTGQVAQALSALAGPYWTFAGRGEADLADESSVLAALRRQEWDGVINAAAYTAVDKAEADHAAAAAVNAKAPGAMAAFCAEEGIPFVHISTDYVFDGSKDAPYGETDAICPINVYGRTKAEGEQLIQSAGGASAILRTSWVYAPQGQNFVRTMVRLGQEREELRIVSDQRGAPTAAFDLADGIVAILGQAKDFTGPEIFHMTAAGETSWHAFALEIFRIATASGLRTPKSILPITTADYNAPAPRPLNSRLDCAKLKRERGIVLPHWSESLQTCMDLLLADRPQERSA